VSGVQRVVHEGPSTRATVRGTATIVLSGLGLYVLYQVREPVG
jgi:hypothetical protein